MSNNLCASTKELQRKLVKAEDDIEAILMDLVATEELKNLQISIETKVIRASGTTREVVSAVSCTIVGIL